MGFHAKLRNRSHRRNAKAFWLRFLPAWPDKMPDMMKLNTVEGAKMLLLHRKSCGMGASKQIHRKAV